MSIQSETRDLVAELSSFGFAPAPVTTQHQPTSDELIAHINSTPRYIELAETINKLNASIINTLPDNADKSHYAETLTPEEAIKNFLPEIYLTIAKEFMSATDTVTGYKTVFSEQVFNTEDAAAITALSIIKDNQLKVLSSTVKAYKALKFHQDFLATFDADTTLKKSLKQLKKLNRQIQLTLPNEFYDFLNYQYQLKNPLQKYDALEEQTLFISSIIESYFIVTETDDYLDYFDKFYSSAHQPFLYMSTVRENDIDNDTIEETLYRSSLYETLYNTVK